MPSRDSIPVARSRVRASVPAAGRPSPAVVVDVDELVLEQALVDHGQAAGPHEPAGGEGGQPELLGPSLGGEPPLDHGEGALGAGRGRRVGQGQVDPQPVVARRVGEAGADPHAPARRPAARAWS